MSDADKDEQWLDAIAGRTPADKEAAALREAMLKRPDPAALSPQELEQGAERLLFRLRREGLVAGRTARARWVPLALAASIVVAAGVGLWPLLEAPKPDETTIRGGELQQLVHADPAAHAAQLAAELQSHGLTVVQRPADGGVIVEALVQNRDDPQLDAVLARYRLKLPPSGPLLVRVSPPRR